MERMVKVSMNPYLSTAKFEIWSCKIIYDQMVIALAFWPWDMAVDKWEFVILSWRDSIMKYSWKVDPSFVNEILDGCVNVHIETLKSWLEMMTR